MEHTRRYTATAFTVAAAGYCLLFLLNKATAQEAKQDETLYALFEKTLDKYHDEKYDEAIQLATRIRKLYPDEPAGVFGLLVTYQTMMRNYRVRNFEAQYDSLLDLSVELAKNALKKNNKDGRIYFYLGCAYGSRSIYYAQRGKWLAAFKDGSRVLNNFKKAVAYSPEFYDAYYGLGLYKYWLGAKAKLLRFLSFAKDQRREGIEQIKITAEKGRFLKVDGMYGLLAVYFNEGQYEKALEISEELYEIYPENPTLLYRRGRIFQALERWSEARQHFETLYGLLTAARYQSVSYKIECLFQIAKCEYHLGNYLETQRFCQEAIRLEKYCDFSKEIDGPLEKFSEIEKQLHELDLEIKELRLTQANGKHLEE
ncbi:MAG: tetratricopeptide repeat protein [bacterium]